MLPRSRLIQRCLLAALVAAALALGPLSASAASPDVDALWNQPQGVSVDSAFYVVQAWWDDLARGRQGDPTLRGMDELAQANTDLLNAYTLLQKQRSGAGAQPVAVIDPFLSGIYNFITGSHVRAPVGSVFAWTNQSLLKLEGRGSTDDIVRRLLADYQARQLAAEQDLQIGSGASTQAVWAGNASRETAMLLKIKGLASPGDGVAPLVIEADHATTMLAAKHQAARPTAAPTPAKGTAKDGGKGTGKDDGKDQHGPGQHGGHN